MLNFVTVISIWINKIMRFLIWTSKYKEELDWIWNINDTSNNWKKEDISLDNFVCAHKNHQQKC